MQQNDSPPDLIGQSQAFLDALAHASAIAPIDRPVLIIGERGTGKELLAGRLHFLSLRWEGPLVKVNCAAMNEELLESELFGHEAGAFTGASKKHRGRFERAQGGTLFLDEIASSSPRVQEKLLRVIEYGEYERVGGEETRRADVRIVAAANADLRALSATGKFRADLLDRLAFDVISAPPLRHRREDIALLSAHFAHAMANEMNIPYPGFSANAIASLHAYAWPGNVRELRNATERALFHWSRNTHTPQIEEIIIDPFPDIPDGPVKNISTAQTVTTPTQLTTPHSDLRAHLDSVERTLTVNAIVAAQGNQKRAAKRLSLTYDQLRGIIRKHDIDVKSMV